jgi:hypothetical protein
MVVVLQGTIIRELHPQPLIHLHRGSVLMNIQIVELVELNHKCFMEIEEVKKQGEVQPFRPIIEGIKIRIRTQLINLRAELL